MVYYFYQMCRKCFNLTLLNLNYIKHCFLSNKFIHVRSRNQSKNSIWKLFKICIFQDLKYLVKLCLHSRSRAMFNTNKQSYLVLFLSLRNLEEIKALYFAEVEKYLLWTRKEKKRTIVIIFSRRKLFYEKWPFPKFFEIFVTMTELCAPTPLRCQFHQQFTYKFFIRTSFWQLFLVTFWLWRKICTKNSRV